MHDDSRTTANRETGAGPADAPERVELFMPVEHEQILTPEMLLAGSQMADGCMHIYRVQWLESLLALDGSRRLCRFRSPDAESLRAVMLATQGQAHATWAGREILSPSGGDDEVNVVVERRFDSPVVFDDIAARENAHIECLQLRNVSFQRSFFSRDGLRMVCLYRAPDAESVREAQRQAGMPVERIWACRRLGPWMLDSGE